MRKWRIEDSKELYNIDGWGREYFDVNAKGNMVVTPRSDVSGAIDLKILVDELKAKDIALPVLLRFPDILDSRIKHISRCFEQAAAEYDYQGKYYNVYPIKVNQQRPVVEEIVRFGKAFNIGLEAGSKPELHAVLAVMDNPEALIVCNGYKDEEFVELAILAQKMGKRVFLVIEKFNEMALIAKVAKAHDVKPNIGIRIKLSSSGSGKWEESGGDHSKFGLNASELLSVIDLAKELGMQDCLKLIHFHLGSQITNIRKIKAGFKEVAQFYVEMRKLGCAIDYVDIGGGLGIDYDGTKSSNANSVNYSIQEYANDAMSILKDAADKSGFNHPHIISEAGRALTAHHSLLVFNVLESSKHPSWEEGPSEVDEHNHEIIHELIKIYESITTRSMQEHWHDAMQLREEGLDLFALGMFSLKDRALTQRLFWSIARKVWQLSQKLRHPPEEFLLLNKMLADKYFCNFSIFQSLPDSWAIDQLFPVVPLHRLDEEPNQNGTLQDITCDSDGKIDHFITGWRGEEDVLPLHALKPDEPYLLGAFLVGAYQEILGDLHNLFGDTNVVHVSMDNDGAYVIDQEIEGETVADVLDYVQFEAEHMVEALESWVSACIKSKKISAEEGREFLERYRSGLSGYTYLA